MSYICPQCGADIEIENGCICEYCGYELTVKKCISCGKDIPVDESSCPFCGVLQNKNGEKTDPNSLISGLSEALSAQKTETGEVISNIPQSPEIQGSAFNSMPPQIFGHEEAVEEIIDDYSEDEFIEEEIGYDNDIEGLFPENKPFVTSADELSGIETHGINENKVSAEEIPEQPEHDKEIADEEPESPEISAAGLNIGHQEEVQYMNFQESPVLIEETKEHIQSASAAKGRECPKCGFVNPGIAKFCLGCGTALETEGKIDSDSKICSECGFENNDSALFCMVCGARLQETADVISAHDVSEEPMGTDTPEKGGAAAELLFKVKINYDNNNKFQYKFVYNKIKEINREVSDNELKMLMNNNIFMVDITAGVFDSFKSELEDLDCTVEKISESVKENPAVSTVETEDKESDANEISGYSLMVKGMNNHDNSWKNKFVKMLTLMIPDIDEKQAFEIASSESKRIPIENEETARDLQKIISRLGCITQIIEHKGGSVVHKGETVGAVIEKKLRGKLNRKLKY